MVKGPNIVDKRTNPDEARKQRNKLNRQRAKQMERRISQIFLKNTRGVVPMSGAGWRKGDNDIPLPNHSGNMLIECKCSELTHPAYGAGIPLRYEFFSKAQCESEAMGSRLATLAIHFHNFTGDYIFFRVCDIPIIESISGNNYTFGGPILDGRYNKAGKPFIANTVYRSILLNGFKQSTGTVPNVRYETFIGPYIIVDVLDFKQLLGYT